MLLLHLHKYNNEIVIDINTLISTKSSIDIDTDSVCSWDCESCDNNFILEQLSILENL